MEKEWRLADAKNKLTEVVNMALIEPQIINRRNDTVIVLSAEEYYRLLGNRKSFKSCLLSPPSSLEDLDFNRDKSTMRDIEL